MIADKAKVSRGTVDRVLHDRPGVSDETREKVNKVAKELGYKPNIAGKALAFQNNPLKIGVILLNTKNSIFSEVHKGVEAAYEELKDFSIDVESKIMKSVDIDEQINCIDTLVKKGISALVISPLDSDRIRKKLNYVTDNDIKLITYNTDLVGIKKLCFVGQDLYKSGRVAGELMAKLIPTDGNVVIFTGSTSIKALRERVSGFTDIINSEYSNIKITNIIENMDVDEQTYNRTLDILKGSKDIKGIFITGEGIKGVADALVSLGRRDVKLITYDTNGETIKFLKDKIIDFTITQDPFNQGYLPIKIIFDYLFKGLKPTEENIFTKLEIVTKENINIK